jgi:replication fork protection complex subunit Csm3/Swi3
MQMSGCLFSVQTSNGFSKCTSFGHIDYTPRHHSRIPSSALKNYVTQNECRYDRISIAFPYHNHTSMKVRLSVWRDEAKGLVNGKEPGENGSNNVIDLTDPNFEGADVNDDSSSLRAPSLPPSSSEAEDDDFDIDAVVREEEKRLAAFRAQRSVSPAPPAPKAKYKLLPPEAADGMDIDEEAMWNDLEIFDDPIPNPAPPPPKSSKPSLLVDDQDEEMWDMVRELEREEYTASKQLPVSSVSSAPSAGNANTSFGTNDEDFDDIYA